jgi:hypothetical protein
MALTGALITGGVALGKGILDTLSRQREDRKQRGRYERLLKRIGEIRQRAYERGVKRIMEQTQGALAGSRMAAARRAAATGESAEGFIIPAEGQITTAGSRAMSEFAERVGGQFDQAELQAEFGYADRPIPESPAIGIADTLLSIGQAGLNYKMDQDYLGILKNAYQQRFGQLEQSNDMMGSYLATDPTDVSQYGSGFYSQRALAMGRKSPLRGGL